jgi:Flp pilus assembly protein TadB
MSDETNDGRFAGSDMEFWVIYVIVAVFVAIVALLDRAFDIAILSLLLACMCAVFGWQRRRRKKGKGG